MAPFGLQVMHRGERLRERALGTTSGGALVRKRRLGLRQAARHLRAIRIRLVRAGSMQHGHGHVAILHETRPLTVAGVPIGPARL